MQYNCLFYPIELSLKGTHWTILHCTYHAFFVLLPVTGWVAESWLGRYQAILSGCLVTNSIAQHKCYVYSFATVECIYSWPQTCSWVIWDRQKRNKYRLDDESRWLQHLDHRGNRKFRHPERVVQGRLTSFQGDLNPVVTVLNSLSNVFRL